MDSVVILQSQLVDVLTYRPFNKDLRDASASKKTKTKDNIQNTKAKKDKSDRREDRGVVPAAAVGNWAVPASTGSSCKLAPRDLQCIAIPSNYALD